MTATTSQLGDDHIQRIIAKLDVERAKEPKAVPHVIQAAYKFALDPTPTQQVMMKSHAGGARYVYNWAVATVSDALNERKAQVEAGIEPTVELPTHFGLCKTWTELKDRYAVEPIPETGRNLGWVGNNSSGTYQAAIRDAHGAWQKMFDSRAGRRAGRAMGRPRWKKKGRSPDRFQVHGETLNVMADAVIRPARKKKLKRGQTSHPVAHGPAASKATSKYFNLPKIGPVKIPGKVRVGSWVDSNARLASKLHRLIRKSDATGPVECPTCRAALTITDKHDKQVTAVRVVIKKKDGEPDDRQLVERKCKTCRGTGEIAKARIVRASISRGGSGVWWCSVTVEAVVDLPTGPTRRQRDGGGIGIDLAGRNLSLKHLAVVSNGDVYDASRFLESSLGDLRRMQRALSRTEKDSHRRAIRRRQVGALHEQVALMRRDATNRITTEFARNFALIGVEGWNAQSVATSSAGLPKRLRRQRNRALADAAPGMLRWQLGYKTTRLGSRLFVGEPDWETDRICSVCTAVRTKLLLPTEERFRCPGDHVIDRRLNAAKVIGMVAQGHVSRELAETTKPRGGDVRPDTLRSAGPSPSKRVARSGSSRQRRKPGKTRSPGPGGLGIP